MIDVAVAVPVMEDEKPVPVVIGTDEVLDPITGLTGVLLLPGMKLLGEAVESGGCQMPDFE